MSNMSIVRGCNKVFMQRRKQLPHSVAILKLHVLVRRPSLAMREPLCFCLAAQAAASGVLLFAELLSNYQVTVLEINFAALLYIVMQWISLLY